MGRKMIPFYRSDYDNKEFRAVKRVLKSGWTTQGPVVKQLEDEWAKLSGYKYCLAVNSATSGLLLAHIAAETKKVYAPVYTFAATINVLELLGREIVFLDCAKNSFNCSARDTTIRDCFMPVAISGDLYFSDIWNVKKESITILDAAHCWPDIKTNVDIAVWSLYANKNIPCGDGGMIGTNNKDWADKIRLLRNHGMSVDTLDRFNSDKPKFFYDVPMPGYKLNMTDLHAAIALEQLKKMPKNKVRRNKLIDRYDAELPNGIGRPFYAGLGGTEHLYMALCAGSYERDCLLYYLHAKGISCSVHYKPIHRMSYYRDKYHLTDDMFPNASLYADCEISLPLYPSLTDKEQKYIIKCIKGFYK